MRKALEAAGYDDLPKNGLYVIGGLAIGNGEIPLGRLIRDLRLSKQAAGQLVDTLVARGYLRRSVDEQDRRKLIVTLADRGQDAAAVQQVARKRVDTQLVAKVGREDIDALRRTLSALIEMGEWDDTSGSDED
jgi:DNA-binding MarR family transcriptional regulator